MAETPLYEQVRHALATSIANGQYQPGDKLPSEAAIAREMGVNRLTVRRALEELGRAGRVHSRQGSGTYVAEQIARLPVTQSLSPDSLVAGLTEQISSHGHAYEDQLLAAVKVDQPALNLSLGLPVGPLWRVDNALMVDGSPWMWSSSWFPHHLLANPRRHWSTVSGLYGQLTLELGELIPVWRAFSAEAASAHDAELLDIKLGTPVIIREGLTADSEANPFLRVTRRARMDRVSYVLSY